MPTLLPVLLAVLTVQQRADEVLGSAAAGMPELGRLALQTFLDAEDDLRAGRAARCSERIAQVWKRAPQGSEEWARLPTQPGGLNIGSPTCYYALRMLDAASSWRVAQAALPAARRVRPVPVVLSVVLVGRSKGLEPSSLAELEQGTGELREHELDAALLADGHALVRESLWLFGEYVLAATQGHLALETRFVELPELELAVECRSGPPRTAAPAEGQFERVWGALDERTRRESDWWWVLHPSCVPEEHPDFATAEFITGGMGVGPNGGPCFQIDDRWLVRKPPHLGHGPCSHEERRAYLPQWLQHEFFHHLFREYPRFELEAKSHQWFDRTSWPQDFEGRFEPDYYAESLAKRLASAEPPLWTRLRYAAPPEKLLRGLRAALLAGRYERQPVQNDWHRVRLECKDETTLRWTNAANRSWTLELDASAGVLLAGRDNPYFDADAPQHNRLEIVFARGPEGEFTSAIEGLRWNGELYRRVAR